jgi:hypothetical protein
MTLSVQDYVLVLLFVKYVSDKYAGQKDAMSMFPRAAALPTWPPSGQKETATRSTRSH